MSLFESSLLGQAETGQLACFDSVPEDFTEVFLQNFELHGRSIALELWDRVSPGSTKDGAGKTESMRKKYRVGDASNQRLTR